MALAGLVRSHENVLKMVLLDLAHERDRFAQPLPPSEAEDSEPASEGGLELPDREREEGMGVGPLLDRLPLN